MILSENHEAFRCLRPINRPSMIFVDNIRIKLEKNQNFRLLLTDRVEQRVKER